MFESAAHTTREARATLAPAHVVRPRRRPATRGASGVERRGTDHGSRLPELDAVVVGGGPAGLSAALVLGRARRKVLVLDTGKPANAVSKGVGGLLGRSGVLPAELRHEGREQLAEYPTVEVAFGEVTEVERLADGSFEVQIEDEAPVTTRSIVLAHGLRYDPPELPGIDGLWGSSVFHCPFCDGWEVRDRPLALQGNGRAAAQSAMVISGWSSDLVLCTDGPADLGPERAALEAVGVRIREEPITRLVGTEGRLQRIEFAAGPAEEREGLFVRTRRGQPNGLAETLGCELTDEGTIVTDGEGRTTVAGVYAAGDAATERLRSVANAMGTGSRVAYSVSLDLVPQLA
jgi:thioredoxin reductase